jgi:hypothetical protein
MSFWICIMMLTIFPLSYIHCFHSDNLFHSKEFLTTYSFCIIKSFMSFSKPDHEQFRVQRSVSITKRLLTFNWFPRMSFHRFDLIATIFFKKCAVLPFMKGLVHSLICWWMLQLLLTSAFDLDFFLINSLLFHKKVWTRTLTIDKSGILWLR